MPSSKHSCRNFVKALQRRSLLDLTLSVTVLAEFSAIRAVYMLTQTPDCPQAERAAALMQLTELKTRLSELEKEMSQYGSCDPVAIESKRRAITLAHDAAIRWTGGVDAVQFFKTCVDDMPTVDNVALLMSHFTRQNNVEAADVRQYLGITEDFEEIC